MTLLDFLRSIINFLFPPNEYQKVLLLLGKELAEIEEFLRRKKERERERDRRRRERDRRRRERDRRRREEREDNKRIDVGPSCRDLAARLDKFDNNCGNHILECPICQTNRKDLAFGCGHLTCGECGSKVSKCPICRVRITSRLRIYIG